MRPSLLSLSFTPLSQCGMIYTFSFRTKITFCLLHHVIDRFFNEQLIMND